MFVKKEYIKYNMKNFFNIKIFNTEKHLVNCKKKNDSINRMIRYQLSFV